MSRPPKLRRVCEIPENLSYGPIEQMKDRSEQNTIIMSIVEYECMRLMDYEGMNQTEAAEAMGVARSSVQRTYESLRKKIALCLVEGKQLHIEGGDFMLCNDLEELPDCKNCPPGRRRRGRE